MLGNPGWAGGIVGDASAVESEGPTSTGYRTARSPAICITPGVAVAETPGSRTKQHASAANV